MPQREHDSGALTSLGLRTPVGCTPGSVHPASMSSSTPSSLFTHIYRTDGKPRPYCGFQDSIEIGGKRLICLCLWLGTHTVSSSCWELCSALILIHLTRGISTFSFPLCRPNKWLSEPLLWWLNNNDLFCFKKDFKNNRGCMFYHVDLLLWEPEIILYF